MINSCLFPGTHYVLVYFSTSTSLCLGPGTDIYTEEKGITVAYFLIHTMCLCISLLALACAWDQGLISTQRKKETTVAYFLVHTLRLPISLLALACAWDQGLISTVRI